MDPKTFKGLPSSAEFAIIDKSQIKIFRFAVAFVAVLPNDIHFCYSSVNYISY